MRIVKIAVWIVCVFLIQTVFGSVIHIYGIVPDLLLAFALVFALHERNIAVYAGVLLICGITDGSGVGHLFPAVVFITAAAGVISHAAGGRMRYMPCFVKVLFITAAAAFAIGITEYFACHFTISADSILKGVLPYTVYTMLGTCIIYPLVTRTLFRGSQKKLILN